MHPLLDELALNWHVYAWIILFLILTGAGLPIPEEVPIVAAGVLSSGPDAELVPWLAFASCIVGALLGDSLMYAIGRGLGRPFLVKYAFFAHWLHADRERKMEQLLRRHGLKTFFLARFMIGVRGPMYMAAGMMRVPWRVFIAVDAFCATIVVGIVFTLAMLFGDEIADLIHEYQVLFTIAVIVVAALATAIYFYRRRRLLRDQDRLAEPREPEPATSEESR